MIVRVLVIGLRVMVSVTPTEVIVESFVVVVVDVECIVEVDVVVPLSTVLRVVDVASV